MLAQTFHLAAPGAHVPRVRIDDLVVSRESWTLPAAEPTFADTADEAVAVPAGPGLGGRHGMPRHVFLRFTGERKPIYADLTSLASIDLIARVAAPVPPRLAGDATVNVVEMMPTPDQAWLADAQGQHYTAEVRMVAVDQVAAARKAGRLIVAVYEFPTSFGQRRMWLLAEMDPGEPTYNMAWALWLDGALDCQRPAAGLGRRAGPARGAAHHLPQRAGVPVQVIEEEPAAQPLIVTSVEQRPAGSGSRPPGR